MNYVYITLQDLDNDFLTFISKKVKNDNDYISSSLKIKNLKQKFIKANASAVIAKIDLNTMKLEPLEIKSTKQIPVNTSDTLTTLATSSIIQDGHDESALPDEIFDGMKIISYGKGIVLIPSSEHIHYGKGYYEDGCGNQGWWNKNCNGWFFKKQFLQNLITNGAELDESIDADKLTALISG